MSFLNCVSTIFEELDDQVRVRLAIEMLVKPLLSVSQEILSVTANYLLLLRVRSVREISN